MNRNQRIGLIVGALLLAIVAFVLLRPDDSGEDTQPTQATTQPAAVTTPQATIPETPTTGTTTEEPAPRPSARPAFTELEVGDGKPTGGVKKISVTKGDTVRLRIKSDAADEVHVHGYDLTKDVGPGGAATFVFPANIDGVFEIELHGTSTQIAELEVQP